jgi:hypothetical protein
MVLKTPPRKKFLVTKPHIKKRCETANVPQELQSHGGGKLPCALTQHHAMRAYWGSEGLASRILDLSLVGG